jgi:DNA-binding CsgD family transcriptional regulator/tetratricopeptide (TPR) repeat protein
MTDIADDPPTNVFGRESEHAQIKRLLDLTWSGPAGVSLEGGPGIGKSTLWREALALARRRGLEVIATAPSEPDSTLAFAGLGDLFDGLTADILAALPGPQRRALDGALFVEDADLSPSDVQALPRAVLSVVRNLAAHAPLLVAIDDEQWLDRASARVLAFALARLREERVCVLLARRPHSAGTLWPVLERDFGAEGLPALTLEPLQISAIQRVVARGLNRPIGRSVLRQIYDISGGNPLYALAIAREFARERHGDPRVQSLPIPRSLTDAVAQRLDDLDPRAMDPLLVIASVSQPTITLLRSVLPQFTLADLDSPEEAGVIEVAGERLAFTHPLLASTVYAKARAARRRELHRLLAEVIAEEEQCAYHLARGTEAPDRVIAGTIELAARAAARRGAPETAAELLEHASRLTPLQAVEVRRSRTIAAAEFHAVAGDAFRARELLEALLPELPHGPVRARALLQLSEVRTDNGEAVQDLLEQALASAGDHDRLCTRIEINLAGFASNRAKFSEMLVHAAAALDAADRTGDPGLLALALAAHATAGFFNGHGIRLESLRRGIELEDSASARTMELPSGALAEILFWSDDYEAARPAYERIVQLARERGEVYDTGALLFEWAILEWYAGNREDAERLRSSTAELVRDQGEHDLDLWLMWGESLFAAGRGDLDGARVAAIQAMEVAEQIANPLIAMLPTTVLASVELWTGHPIVAHDLLSPVRESFLSSGLGFIGSMTLGMWSVDIDALIAGGRVSDAAPILDDLLGRVASAENPNASAIAERCRGLLLAAHGDTLGAIDAMDRALAEHARRPLTPEIARTLLERGTLQRRAKRKTASKQSLEEALAIYERLDARMWADRARDELNRIGLRRPAVSEGLTPAQERVAQLVASGMTNREIASTLYMSPRSVESHLTKVYREHGVRSRSQLVAVLAGRDATSATEPRHLSDV